LLALRAGLDAPPTRILSPDGPLTGQGDLSFPAVVKPLRSEVSTEGVLRRFEVERVDSREELDVALRTLPDAVGLVQPYINGQLISVNGVAWNGELIAVNQHAVHRIWPERCGYCIYGETIPLDEPRRLAVAALMEDLEWSGVFNLQLIQSEGRSYAIDLNPRFYQSLALTTAAGLNLPAIWTSLVLGLPFEAGQGRVGVRFRAEKDDLRAAIAQLRRGHVTALAALLPRRRTVHAHFSVRDPRPVLSVLSDGRAALRRRRSTPPPANADAPEPAERVDV
jgi:predicted ATP-grasp superfamily ATP-dependent carboligase